MDRELEAGSAPAPAPVPPTDAMPGLDDPEIDSDDESEGEPEGGPEAAEAPVPAPAPAFDMPDEMAAVVEALKTTPYAVLPPRTADTLLHVVLPSAAALLCGT